MGIFFNYDNSLSTHPSYCLGVFPPLTFHSNLFPSDSRSGRSGSSFRVGVPWRNGISCPQLVTLQHWLQVDEKEKVDFFKDGPFFSPFC